MEAIFSGISAFAELVLELLRLLFSGVSDLGYSLQEGADPKDRRRHFWKGMLKLAIPVAVIVGTVGYFGYSAYERHRDQRLRAATEQTLALCADQLDANRDDRGDYIHDEPKSRDAWGRELRVNYHETALGEGLVVVSAGADGEFESADDLQQFRGHFRGKRVAHHVGELVGEQFNRIWSGENSPDKDSTPPQ